MRLYSKFYGIPTLKHLIQLLGFFSLFVCVVRDAKKNWTEDT